MIPNSTYIDKDSLLEGCYHEMGHILAYMMFSTQVTGNEGISFSREDNTQPYKFDTSLPKFPNTKDNPEGFVYGCFGGGVFQQMMTLYYSGNIKFSILEKFMFFSKDCALKHYLKKHISPIIDGMEMDTSLYYYLINEINNDEKTLKWRIRNKEFQDEHTIKNKLVDLFFPYMKNYQIKCICNNFVETILNHLGTQNQYFLPLQTIKKYL